MRGLSRRRSQSPSPRSRGKPPAAIALALTVGLLVAGCGGGGDDDGTSPGADGEPLSKSDYIAQADEICAQGTLRIGQAAREQFGTAQPTAQQAQQFGQDEVVPSLEETLSRLRDLPAPSGDQPTLAKLYDALEQGIKELSDDPGLFLDQNVGGAFDEANRLAKTYGFTQCGQG